MMHAIKWLSSVSIATPALIFSFVSDVLTVQSFHDGAMGRAVHFI